MAARRVLVFTVILAFVTAVSPLLAVGKAIQKSPLDHATLHQSSISRGVPVRVHTFSTEEADLGTGAKKNKPKYRQIAEEMRANAPEMLLNSLIENLKERGFEDVKQIDSDQPVAQECLIIEGEFTRLNPGSQAKRYWAGFGAGKSQVCAAGRVINGNGDVLLSFEHCRHEAMGIMGGESKGQMAKDIHATGAHLADFMEKWADGAYAN